MLMNGNVQRMGAPYNLKINGFCLTITFDEKLFRFLTSYRKTSQIHWKITSENFIRGKKREDTLTSFGRHKSHRQQIKFRLN
jgi:hypothetical protein